MPTHRARGQSWFKFCEARCVWHPRFGSASLKNWVPHTPAGFRCVGEIRGSVSHGLVPRHSRTGCPTHRRVSGVWERSGGVCPTVRFRVTQELGAPHTGGFPVCGRDQEYVCPTVWFRVTQKLGAPHTGGFPVCGRDQEYVCPTVWFRVTQELGAPHTGGFPVCGRDQGECVPRFDSASLKNWVPHTPAGFRCVGEIRSTCVPRFGSASLKNWVPHTPTGFRCVGEIRSACVGHMPTVTCPHIAPGSVYDFGFCEARCVGHPR